MKHYAEHRMPTSRDSRAVLSRRELLARSGMGLAGLALAELPAEAVATASEPGTLNPLAPKGPQFAGTAKRVIHIFANGGPSQVDTFDPKPLLAKYAGKPMPTGNLPTERKTAGAMPSPLSFKRYGKSGTEVSEIFKHVGEVADELCVVR